MGEESYAGSRDRLREGLSALTEMAEARASGRIADAARELEKKLVEQRFNTVVVGEFKRGKTTLVNALLGEEILPAAVVPLTSIVTAVTWGEEPRAEIAFRDGRIETVGPERLAEFVTERGNPGNGLEVDRAVLYYPAPDLRDGVFLVDTPGVGSVYRHNTEAAYAFVPQSDAAIFLTSADPPISETERRFLEDVREESARMFFVLNKIDYLSEGDRAEAVQFTKEVLRQALGQDAEVYPISARQALMARLVGDSSGLEASGFAAFEQAFRRFLLEDKGRTILLSVAQQVRKLVADERNSVEVEERTAGLPEDRLAAALAEMERVFIQARESKEDIRTLLRREHEKMVRLVEEDLARLRAEQTRALLDAAEDFLAESLDLRVAADELDRRVKERLRQAIDRWRVQEDRRVAEAFTQATERYVDETNLLVERTVRLCGELLHVQLAFAAARSGISAQSRFSYSFFEVPTIVESLLPDVRGYLPKGVARKLLLREVRETVPSLVDKHCGRLRWDFVQRLDGAALALDRELGERLEATIESLQVGVRRANEDRTRSAEEASRARERLAATRAKLAAIDGRLANLLQQVEAGQREGTL